MIKKFHGDFLISPPYSSAADNKCDINLCLYECEGEERAINLRSRNKRKLFLFFSSLPPYSILHFYLHSLFLPFLP